MEGLGLGLGNETDAAKATLAHSDGTSDGREEKKPPEWGKGISLLDPKLRSNFMIAKPSYLYIALYECNFLFIWKTGLHTFLLPTVEMEVLFIQ